MKDSAEKRAEDSKTLTDKGAAKADMEAELQTHQDTKASTESEMAATGLYSFIAQRMRLAGSVL